MNYSILLPAYPYIEEEDEASARIVIEGLHPGYGVTIGNALRRVLFSSLPGAAVTRVKIEGASHEFSTLPGVLEDVLAILLNIKQLRFRVHTEGPTTISFEAKGETEVTAKNIKTPSDVEIVNKDQHIATLTKKDAKLLIELTVERGVGYRAKETLETERIEAGIIVLDAIFTPVRKISYHVENMRVGTETDYNRLIFYIDTDGTIAPREAFLKGLEILMGQLSELKMFRQKGEEPIRVEDTEEAVLEPADSALSQTPLEDVKFSRHTLNALLKNDIRTIGQLSKKTEKDLRLIDGIGDKAVDEIAKELTNYNFSLERE